MTTVTVGTSPLRMWKRVEGYKLSKAAVLLCCIVSTAAAITLGFNWGGWTTDEAALGVAGRAAADARTRLAATICADRFITSPHAQEQTALLRTVEDWQRVDYLRRGGWLTLPGLSEPIAGSGALCVQQILNAS